MLSKSKRELLNQLKDMSGEEVFRAWLEAGKRGENDLATTIQRFTPSDKASEAENLSIYYLIKSFLILNVLLNKAILAINFYNTTSINLISPNGFKTELNTAETKTTVENISSYQAELDFIDEQTKNKLDLEEFSELTYLYQVFDLWKTLEPHLETLRQLSEARKEKHAF